MSINVLRLPGGEAALRRALALLGRRLPLFVSVVLLLSTAWVLARLTWEVLPAPRTATPIYKQGPGVTSRRFDFRKLADQHLFGVAGAARAGGSADNTNAPETTLDLTLSGIAADANQTVSRAIIESGGKQQTYGIGAQLPGGAVIKDILPDQVLLNLNGKTEALRLPKFTGDQAGAPGASMSPMSAMPRSGFQTTGAPPPANLGQLRHQVMRNPERLLDVVRAMPVMEHGRFVGYRVFPAGNPRLFQQMGLKPGDVVTAVNGISLDNPADSMRILSKLKTSDQVSVTFTRNGQQQTQVLQMQDGTQ
ncbi:MAG TPA: type II secretion system protein GspC [Gammaproteobacteria bacterium]|nr:type II secretion system protein GspC [Gammaproteobacteria bacterium]